MVTSTSRQYKLRYLAAFTALMLAGIIVLQFYWLYTSYTQQRKRFKADVSSIVSEVAMYESMVNVYNTSAGTGAPTSIVINYSNSSGKRGQGLPFTVKVSDDGEERGSSRPGVYISPPVNGPHIPITPQKLDSLLESCRVMVDSELRQREIRAPFQLALIDNKGAIVKATCDTLRFHHITTTSPTKALITEDAKPRISLRVAFPDASLYLVRRMALVLAITVLLIIIGAWSFSYMLVHFFRQKKMADIRNDFMNNMTHELKTPISAALVAVEMVEGKRHPLDEAAKAEYLGIAKGELNRLTMLIDKVLKMAAFDHNEILMNKSTLLLADLLNEAKDNLRGVLENTGAKVRIDNEYATLTVYGDKIHLVNVFQNLLENAIKYNDKPSQVVIVNVSCTDAGTKITFTDNGRGIPAAYVSKVFDKFFRVPMGDVHDIKGYGLGLSYVKAIVTLHGGTVGVESKEKEGSIFTVYLPVKS